MHRRIMGDVCSAKRLDADFPVRNPTLTGAAILATVDPGIGSRTDSGCRVPRTEYLEFPVFLLSGRAESHAATCLSSRRNPNHSSPLGYCAWPQIRFKNRSATPILSLVLVIGKCGVR